MAQKVILAKAGSGKTYYICHQIEATQRNLILAYTHENVNNIRRELDSGFGEIPVNTAVTTFDSFIYNECVLPFWKLITDSFKASHKRINGITLDEPLNTFHRNYKVKTDIEHYFDSSDRLYCSLLTEMLMEAIKKDKSLSDKIATRINMFFDQVLIDEFQDFREFNYSFIEDLSKNLKSIILVGDFYQHSVSGRNNSGSPFKSGKKFVSYEEFCSKLRKSGFTVDDSSLTSSRRCSRDICDFVSSKLQIDISSAGINDGSICWVNSEEIDRILKDDSIMKLVYQNANKYSFRAINWSKSKGNTYNKICIILTDTFKDLDKETFVIDSGKPVSNNRLYVALTRSSGNVHLIKFRDFKKVKQNYSKI